MILIVGEQTQVGKAMTRLLTRCAVPHKSCSVAGMDPAAIKPTKVILCEARSGGIESNRTRPAEYIHDNLTIQTHVIDSCYRAGVSDLLFLSASCAYPRDATQPMREEQVLSGPPEFTSRAYTLAKLAGMEMCRAYSLQYGVRYVSVIPNNIYGPDDKFDPAESHVLGSLVRRFHDAKTRGDARIVLWGSGTARRELIYVDDVAEALWLLLRQEPLVLDALIRSEAHGIINAGTGTDVTIRELAELVAREIGFSGQIDWDATKPDGTPRKLLDSSRLLALGFVARMSLAEGLRHTYAGFREHFGRS